MSVKLVIDNFAGGGGASCGMKMAIGRDVDIAINHYGPALVMHQANHPKTIHINEDVFMVNIDKHIKGKKVGLCWFSPSCTHFSVAKGDVPLSSEIRGSANIVLDWAAIAEPEVIVLENVKEFRKWGPLTKKKKPNKRKIGHYFNKFVKTLRSLGYIVDYNLLSAHHYGTPTTRKRLFLVARRDGINPVWPKRTHARDGSDLIKTLNLKPYIPAHKCIDWNIPGKSIFNRKKPLVDATMKRIFKGIKKFVIDDPNPFIAPVKFNPSGDNSKLVAAFIAKHYGGPNGSQSPGSSLNNPLSTVTAVDHNALVAATMVRHFGTSGGADLSNPMPTVMPGGCGKTSLAEAFLIKYYGTGGGANLDSPMPTVTTRDRMGLVTIYGVDYKIIDIKMRMLTPRELFNANGFPSTYVIDPIMLNGKPMTRTDQVKMVGNSVCPPLAKAVVEANYTDF